MEWCRRVDRLVRKQNGRSRRLHNWPLTPRSVMSAAFFVTFWFLSVPSQLSAGPPTSGIRSVSVYPPFFNPSLGQAVKISFELDQPGNLSLRILDRDGYLVRQLLPEKAFNKGKQSLSWDGRDDRGEIVPNEAYFPDLLLRWSGGAARVNPLESPAQKPESPSIEYFDRQTGQFTYRLSSPSRVHVQAGQASRNKATGELEGPVLRTIVDREPRTGGKILEIWRGYSAGNLVYIPDLSNFVMAVAATPLPSHALITIGNDQTSFVEYALRHRPEKVLAPRDLASIAGSHHEGLNALEDHSPDLVLEPLACTWISSRRNWQCHEGQLALSLRFAGKEPVFFLSQASSPQLFVDGQRVTRFDFSREKAEIVVPADVLTKGAHIVAVNWPSPYGPVAVGVVSLDCASRGGGR